VLLPKIVFWDALPPLVAFTPPATLMRPLPCFTIESFTVAAPPVLAKTGTKLALQAEPEVHFMALNGALES